MEECMCCGNEINSKLHIKFNYIILKVCHCWSEEKGASNDPEPITALNPTGTPVVFFDWIKNEC